MGHSLGESPYHYEALVLMMLRVLCMIMLLSFFSFFLATPVTLIEGSEI